MEILTDRLLLRPFLERDAEDLYEYLKEPTVHCFASMKLSGLEQAQKALAERMAEPDYCFAIVLRNSGKLIGEIFGVPESSDPEQDDKDTFSPCWMLNPEYQGKAYMYEAAVAYFDYLFSERGIRRIYTYTEDTNIPCQKLCERLGMRKEGEFLEYVSFVKDENGEPIYENTRQYAILKKEWLQR